MNSQQEQQVTLTKVKQIVELNKELINFNISFHVQTKDGKPFKAAVVEETALHNDKNIPFELFDGELSGTISSVDNVKYNYMLILSSDVPTAATIHIERERLADFIPSAQPEQPTTTPFLTRDQIKMIIGVIILLIVIYKLSSIQTNKVSVIENTSISVLDKMKSLPLK